MEAMPRLKIITIGDALSGKSALIKRFCEGKFVQKHIPTIGIDYGVKPAIVRGRECRINFFDMSGDPVYFHIRNEFYKDSMGALLVFDMSERTSFENLDRWLKECADYSQQNRLPIVLVGSKSDLKKAVSVDEAQKWGRERGIQ
jgi:DnaJ homolog subfamily C member 27